MPTPRQGLGNIHRLVPSLDGHLIHQANDPPYRQDRIMSRALRGAVDSLLNAPTQHHHSPPASLTAASNARLLAVRRAPALRSASGSPSSARRAASRVANSAKSTRGPGHGSGSGTVVFDAVIAGTLFAATPVQIRESMSGLSRNTITDIAVARAAPPISRSPRPRGTRGCSSGGPQPLACQRRDRGDGSGDDRANGLRCAGSPYRGDRRRLGYGRRCSP